MAVSANQPPAKFGREFRVRTLSALVLAPVALGLFYLGGWPLRLFLILICALGLFEWLKMTSGRPKLMAIGPPYIGLGLAAALWLVPQPLLFLFVLFSIWATDIGAYFAGRLISGPKLAPRISPGKTQSGAVGGLVAAALVGVIWAASQGAMSLSGAALVALGISALSQIGDLAESALKRACGVKDSGTLIPGHGGVLDRVDGFLLAVPVFVAFQIIIGRELGWWLS